MKPKEEYDLFHQLKDMGRSIVKNEPEIKGAKMIIFFKDGRTVEYNSKLDETLNKVEVRKNE